MKKFYIPYIVFCIIVLTLFVINLNKVPKQEVREVIPQTTNNNKKIEISENKETKEKSKESFLLIKASENSVYLYDENNNIIEKLNIDYKNLREYDKNQFLNGIKVKSMQEVYQLMEDFSN